MSGRLEGQTFTPVTSGCWSMEADGCSVMRPRKEQGIVEKQLQHRTNFEEEMK